LRDVPAAPGARVRLTITGEAGGAWEATRSGGDWRLALAEADREATAAVTLDQDAAWRLFTRGIDRERVVGRLVLMGDRALAEPVLGMVSILA
jgi:hypothetical protein